MKSSLFLLPPTQFLRGDRLWSPLCALCRFRLFLELCDFLFLLLYHLGKLRFAFFSCLGVHIEFLSAAVGKSWEVASFPQVIIYLIHASRATLAYGRTGLASASFLPQPTNERQRREPLPKLSTKVKKVIDNKMIILQKIAGYSLEPVVICHSTLTKYSEGVCGVVIFPLNATALCTTVARCYNRCFCRTHRYCTKGAENAKCKEQNAKCC